MTNTFKGAISAIIVGLPLGCKETPCMIVGTLQRVNLTPIKIMSPTEVFEQARIGLITCSST